MARGSVAAADPRPPRSRRARGRSARSRRSSRCPPRSGDNPPASDPAPTAALRPRSGTARSPAPRADHGHVWHATVAGRVDHRSAAVIDRLRSLGGTGPRCLGWHDHGCDGAGRRGRPDDGGGAARLPRPGGLPGGVVRRRNRGRPGVAAAQPRRRDLGHHAAGPLRSGAAAPPPTTRRPRGDRDAVGPRGGRGPVGRAGDRRRRLCGQALLAARAGAAGRGAAPPGRAARQSSVAELDHRHRAGGRRHGGARGPAERRAAEPDHAGVRPAGVPGRPRRPDVRQGGTAAPGVGLGLRGHLDGHGARPAAAGEGRGRPVRPADRPDRWSCGLPAVSRRRAERAVDDRPDGDHRPDRRVLPADGGRRHRAAAPGPPPVAALSARDRHAAAGAGRRRRRAGQRGADVPQPS